MEHAFITGGVLTWARERDGWSQEKLASEFGVSSDDISRWEKGIDFPPFGKAQELAKFLKIPFGYLFLSQVPQEHPQIPDLRTIDGRRARPSPDFIDLLNDIFVKHDWYREYVRDAGAKPVPFVGKYAPSPKIEEVVGDIRDRIDPRRLRRAAPNVQEYLRLLVERSEELRVLVMRGGVVRGNTRRGLSVNEFRGFAISDKLAPLIFINGKDAHAAQVFTLAHELVHLWIGQSGISNPDLTAPDSDAHAARIERFCNRAAAELLVPEREFHDEWRGLSLDSEARVEQLSKRFKVSFPVILRRALELGTISRTSFFHMLSDYQERVDERDRQDEDSGESSSSGGNFYNTFFAANSKRFVRAVAAAVSSGTVSSIEAARLLNVRTAVLNKIAERLG